MKLDDILTEEQLNELDWRKGIATAAIGAASLGSGSSIASTPTTPTTQTTATAPTTAHEPAPEIRAYLDKLMKQPLSGQQAVRAIQTLNSPELTKAVTDIARKKPTGDVRLELAQAIEQHYQQDLSKINQMSFK